MSKTLARDSEDATPPPRFGSIYLIRRISDVPTTVWVPDLRSFCKSLLPWLKISYSALKVAVDQKHASYVESGADKNMRVFLNSTNPDLISSLEVSNIVQPPVTFIQATRLVVILEWMEETFKDTDYSPALTAIIQGILPVFDRRLVMSALTSPCFIHSKITPFIPQCMSLPSLDFCREDLIHQHMSQEVEGLPRDDMTGIKEPELNGAPGHAGTRLVSDERCAPQMAGDADNTVRG